MNIPLNIAAIVGASGVLLAGVKRALAETIRYNYIRSFTHWVLSFNWSQWERCFKTIVTQEMSNSGIFTLAFKKILVRFYGLHNPFNSILELIPIRIKKRVTVITALLLTMVMTTDKLQALIIIDTVMVGDAGNAADTTGYGAVSYIYNIGTYEVNLTQYTAFLNAVAVTDSYGLYNNAMATDASIAGILRSGSSGSYTYSVIGSGNRPVTYVSWFDAARFANWMANGQPTGAQSATTTENGAYTLNGATSGLGFTKNSINPNTGQATTWWIPSEDEWYKAAYYQPFGQGGDADNYWLFPTASNSAPGNVVGDGINQANFNNGVYSVTQSSTSSNDQNYLTDGGAFTNSSSFYGTYDQAGNVWEWNDVVIDGWTRGLRGGSWYSFDHEFRLVSTYRFTYGGPSIEAGDIGFRLASIPEPSSGLLVILGVGTYWFLKRRKALIFKLTTD